jgi:hypothetical protein
MTRGRLTAALAAAVAAAAIPAALAGADSFTPVRLTIKVASVARLNTKLPITVSIGADAGALDSSAPLRLRVKLAPECGGAFAATPGTVLLDKALSPQPATGKSYAATIRGSGRPKAYGADTVCVFVEEQGDSREFATDQSLQVNVSKPCTIAARRYDQARAALSRARRKHRGLAAARRLVANDKRAGLKRCGRGVPL